MQEEPPTQRPFDMSDLEQAFKKILEDRFLDGLIRRFEKLFPDHSSYVEDVVLDEIANLVEGTGPRPKNLRALLTWRTRKRMLDVAKRPLLGEVREEVDHETPERKVIRKEMYSRIKVLLDGWENKAMALVVRLTLEAVYFDEILEIKDIQEFVLEQLGHDLTVSNVWKLRSRGLQRLAKEVSELLREFGDDLDVDEELEDPTDETATD